MNKKKVILKIKNYNNGVMQLETTVPSVKTVLQDIVNLCNKKHGGYILAELSPPYKKRTLPENDKYWAMCTEYGNYLGMTKQEVSLGAKWRAVDEGLWELVDIPFSDKKQPKSTADSNVVEMSVLIDVLYRIAAEDGYVFDM